MMSQPERDEFGEPAGGNVDESIEEGAGLPVGGPAAPRAPVPAGSPVVVLTPKLACRVGAPAAVLLLLVAGFRMPLLFLLLLVAIPLTVATFARVEVTEDTLRFRTWRGWEPPVALDEVVALRLRRARVPVLDSVRKGYGLGRKLSPPLVLRLIDSRGPVFGITVVWWDGWRELAQFAVRLPRVSVGGRSRDRLERYGKITVPKVTRRSEPAR